MARSKFKTVLALACAATATLTLASCEEKGEKDDLASAQSCLDSVPQSNPGLATSCLSLVDGYSSAQASALKCSIYMTAGGLVENKIVNAYNALKDSSNPNKEATFMALLSLNLPDVDTAYANALKGNEFCKASNSKGLLYIGTAIVAGTYFNKMISDTTGSGIDMTSPKTAADSVKAMLDSCTGTMPAAACSADPATLGNTAVTISQLYCGTSGADQSVCGKIDSAVQAAGGDPTEIGQALYCYLNQKTYSSTAHHCL